MVDNIQKARAYISNFDDEMQTWNSQIRGLDDRTCIDYFFIWSEDSTAWKWFSDDRKRGKRRKMPEIRKRLQLLQESSRGFSNYNFATVLNWI